MNFDDFVKLLEDAPIGHKLRDRSGTSWVKSDPMMWDGLNGLRMNAAALYAYCHDLDEDQKKGDPVKKNKKDVGMSQGLF